MREARKHFSGIIILLFPDDLIYCENDSVASLWSLEFALRLLASFFHFLPIGATGSGLRSMHRYNMGSIFLVEYSAGASNAVMAVAV